MRGGTIVTTFIFSIVFLKKKVKKYQIAGSAFALIGVFIVGLSNMIFSDSSESGQDPVYYASYSEPSNCRISPYHCFSFQ
jgi:drug/metabolite transporter (DMT)-like permease